MGTLRDQTLSEMHRSDDQEFAVPENGQRDMCGCSPGNTVTVLSHVGSTGDRRGILGRTIRGHQPVCYPHKEVHNNAKGHLAGQRDTRRMDMSGVLQQNKIQSFSGPPEASQRECLEKQLIPCHHLRN